MQFSTSYLCELGFLTLHIIKSKKRERLCCIEEEMRVCLSKKRPKIETVAKKTSCTCISMTDLLHSCHKDASILITWELKQYCLDFTLGCEKIAIKCSKCAE